MNMLTLTVLAAAMLATPALAQEPGDARPEKDPAQVVCKKFPVTGSLVATRKVCMTRAEWTQSNSREAEHSQKRLKEMTVNPRAADLSGLGGG